MQSWCQATPKLLRKTYFFFEVVAMGLVCQYLIEFLFCFIVIHGRRRHESDRYESASVMSSDIETTSYQDSSDDQSR